MQMFPAAMEKRNGNDTRQYNNKACVEDDEEQHHQVYTDGK